MIIYFIQGKKTGLIKIGETQNLKSRLRQVQMGSPDKLIVRGAIIVSQRDSSYHAKFTAARSHGEWFNPTPELLAFIDALPKTPWTGKSVRLGRQAKQPHCPVQKRGSGMEIFRFVLGRDITVTEMLSESVHREILERLSYKMDAAEQTLIFAISPKERVTWLLDKCPSIYEPVA